MEADTIGTLALISGSALESLNLHSRDLGTTFSHVSCTVCTSDELRVAVLEMKQIRVMSRSPKSRAMMHTIVLLDLIESSFV